MFLAQILAAKCAEVAAAKAAYPLRLLEVAALRQSPARPFAAQAKRADRLSLIAEIKKASPSSGLMMENFDHRALAQTYHDCQVDAISIVTDRPFFQGDLQFVQDVRAITDRPVLRKDFLLDEYQIVESRAAEADAVLLIVAALEADLLARCVRLTHELGMEALVETHSAEEIQRAIDAGATMIGINNRNLGDFQIDLNTTLELAPLVPKTTTLVSESGIRTRQDVLNLEKVGVHALLVGTGLLRSGQIREKIQELRGQTISTVCLEGGSLP